MKKKKMDLSKIMMITWIRNTLFHPPEFNHEYDCMDKNQTLKNLTAILEEIEMYENNSSSTGGLIGGDKSDSTGNIIIRS